MRWIQSVGNQISEQRVWNNLKNVACINSELRLILLAFRDNSKRTSLHWLMLVRIPLAIKLSELLKNAPMVHECTRILLSDANVKN